MGSFYERYHSNPKFKERHKEYMKQKITCSCGVKTQRYNLSHHKKTKKHQRLLNKRHEEMD